MLKVGILTHYYESVNYGGNFQAYALCEILNQSNVYAEQISYKFSEGYKKTLKQKIKLYFQTGFKTFFPVLKAKIFQKTHRKQIKKFEQERREVFKIFNREIIPHSKEICSAAELKNCVNNYDVFITGSDQVWNGYNSGFFLDFVPSEKYKMSYAASIAKTSLSSEEKEKFRESLKSFRAVSVREETAIDLLEGLSPIPPNLSLDPVLLLTRQDWEKLCSDRVPKEKYVFCYFLGTNCRARKAAKRFAEKHKKKVIAVPMGIRRTDRNFADKTIENATPQDFLSLIRNAEAVFTDSFHASVFSIIFQKNFYIFNRTRKGDMSSRIVTLMKLFGMEERFCDTREKEKPAYIDNLGEVQYLERYEEFEKLKEQSIRYLTENLEKAERIYEQP